MHVRILPIWAFPIAFAIACATSPRVAREPAPLPHEPEAVVREPDPVVRDLELGRWHAWLDSPGGELAFGLAFEQRDGRLHAVISNGAERIEVPRVELKSTAIELGIDHYDSKITAELATDGRALDGEWAKRSGKERWTRMKFHARVAAAWKGEAPVGSSGEATSVGSSGESASVASTSESASDGLKDAAKGAATQSGTAHTSKPPAHTGVDGRWKVRFESSTDPAVGVFTTSSDGTLAGTFLTSTGDYRFLAGSFAADRMRLSCFDGAHAFLFDARLDAAGKLEGDFWSGDRWHEKWTAERDDKAALDDPFLQAHWNAGLGLAWLVFPDLDGRPRSLADPAFDGKARIVQLLGSWCPNCHDETAYLAELHKKMRARGLSIVGLAFEHTGEFERDVEQIERMRKRHGAEYPILLAGSSDKAKATAAFPALEAILAFPTTVFLHRDGRVRAVHSGLNGPGTGAEHAALRNEFEKIVDELLAEPESDESATWDLLTADHWRDEREGWLVGIVRGEEGVGRFRAMELTRWDRPTATDPIAQGDVLVRGDSVILDSHAWHFDRRAGVLLDPSDFGRRMTPGARSTIPVVDRRGIADAHEIVAALASNDALWRREALYYATLSTRKGEFSEQLDAAAALSDPDLFVRCTAAWSAGETRCTPAIPKLIECLAHPSPHLRREATRALGKIANKDVIPMLEERLADYDPQVRAAAEAAVAAIEAR